MTRTRVFALIGTAAALFAATLAGGALVRSESAPAAAGPSTRTLVADGLRYQQLARTTAEPRLYTESGKALRRALRRDPDDVRAVLGLASLANTRHRFEEGLRLARRAERLSPGNALAQGAIGDAMFELGRFEEGFRAYERMVSLKPSIAAYARISQAQALAGRTTPAVQAIRLALDAAADPETIAWGLVELGNLHLAEQRPALAERHYLRAVELAPRYAIGLAALAGLRARQGRLADAVALQRRAVSLRPSPEFTATLGDLLFVSGRRADARREYRRVASLEQRLAANGVDTDLDAALFELERGYSPERALRLATRTYRDRRGLEADEAMAWSLALTGRCREALPHSERTLRFPDAHRYYIRGIVEHCLGRRDEARAAFRRALETDPAFSIRLAPLARAGIRG